MKTQSNGASCFTFSMMRADVESPISRCASKPRFFSSSKQVRNDSSESDRPQFPFGKSTETMRAPCGSTSLTAHSEPPNFDPISRYEPIFASRTKPTNSASSAKFCCALLRYLFGDDPMLPDILLQLRSAPSPV